jgi:4-alpha-glucanotransferase
VQFMLFQQWTALRAYCRERRVGLIGDIPIFVAHQSADVWAHPEMFHLDEHGEPSMVAGVPPDYFSPTGQRWGHPLYRWDLIRETGYKWWVDRFRRMLSLFDVVRIDHFIGFHRYWEIPASCPTAETGRWVDGPGADFFLKLTQELGRPPVIAEDLGVVTAEVIALRRQFGFPGMRVLQFAFGGDHRQNDHLPHRHTPETVVYTATHDNDTSAGWFRDLTRRASAEEAAEAGRERDFCLRYLKSNGRELHWDLIRAAMASVANQAIVPAQDLLGLGSKARMNRPSAALGNWDWRLSEGQLTDLVDQASGRLMELTETYGRVPPR